MHYFPAIFVLNNKPKATEYGCIKNPNNISTKNISNPVTIQTNSNKAT